MNNKHTQGKDKLELYSRLRIMHKMSHFSDTLKALLEQNGMTNTDLAERSGVDRTWISRLLKDRQPTREQVAALCATISPAAEDRAKLLVAHLRDEAKATLEIAGIDSRHINLSTARDSSMIMAEVDQPTYGDDWPDLLRVEMAVIACEALRTKEMRELVSRWCAVIERANKEREK